MEITIIRDASAWGALTAAAPLSHSWAYGAAAQAMGARVHRFALSDRGRPLGALQCLERRLGPVGVLYSPDGLWDQTSGAVGKGDVTALRACLRQIGGLALCIAPSQSGVPLGTTAPVATCDPALARPKAWRNAVARAGRQRLCILEHGGCPDWLWRAQAAQARRRRYIGLPRRWLTALERATPGTVRSLAAYRDGVPVAGITVLRHGGRWTYQIGWTDPVGRSGGAHNLLLERALSRAADAGVSIFDLGIAPPGNPGLTRFKLSSGATMCPSRTVRLVLTRRGGFRFAAAKIALPSE